MWAVEDVFGVILGADLTKQVWDYLVGPEWTKAVLGKYMQEEWVALCLHSIPYGHVVQAVPTGASHTLDRGYTVRNFFEERWAVKPRYWSAENNRMEGRYIR